MEKLVFFIFFVVLFGLGEITGLEPLTILIVLLGIFTFVYLYNAHKRAERVQNAQKYERERKRNEEERLQSIEKRRRAIFDEAKNRFRDVLSSEQSIFITKFLEKHEHNIDAEEVVESLSLDEFVFPEDELEVLSSLLKSKGAGYFSALHLQKLLLIEYQERQYEDFKKQFSNFNEPDEYIEKFILSYDDLYPQYIGLFERMVHERAMGKRFGYLRGKVDEKYKQMKQTKYEAELLSGANSVSMDDIDAMDGYGFEDYLGKLYKKMGYQVLNTSYSNDQGADLLVQKDGTKTVIQAKRYDQPVGNKAVQEVVGALKHYGAKKGAVVTNNTYTKSARSLAQSNGVVLIDRAALEKWTKQYSVYHS